MTLRTASLAHSIALVAAMAAVVPAHAAESRDSCTGFIDSLPATIGQSGTWCLRADLATALTTGTAIAIARHNVTIDCNGHAVRGPATAATSTVGITAVNRTNVTVRNCVIDGFDIGASLDGFGITVLDNHLQRLRTTGIAITASPGRVQGNRINDIGWFDARPSPRGILARGDVEIIDNSVSNLRGQNATGRVFAIISLDGQGNQVARNQVFATANTLGGGTGGIQVGAGLAGSRTVARDNALMGLSATEAGIGLACASRTNLTRGNRVVGWATGVSSNCSSSDDVAAP